MFVNYVVYHHLSYLHDSTYRTLLPHMVVFILQEGKSEVARHQLCRQAIDWVGEGRLYRPHPTVDLWDERQIQLQRFNHRIEVQVSEGEFYNVPAPVTDLTLMNGIADSLATDMHIRVPTPIQMQANKTRGCFLE